MQLQAPNKPTSECFWLFAISQIDNRRLVCNSQSYQLSQATSARAHCSAALPFYLHCFSLSEIYNRSQLLHNLFARKRRIQYLLQNSKLHFQLCIYLNWITQTHTHTHSEKNSRLLINTRDIVQRELMQRNNGRHSCLDISKE